MEPQGSDGGGMRLTGAGRFLLFLVGLAVLGYAGWTYRDRLLEQSPADVLVVVHDVAGSTPPARRPRRRSAPRHRRRRGPACSARIKQTGVMRVGMEPDAPPLHFLNDRKQEDGFDFRLAGMIAEASAPSGCRSSKRTTTICPDKLRAGRHRPDHGRLRARSVDRRRRVVERLSRLRPVHDRARGHGRARSESPSDLAGKRIAIYDDPAAERWVKENIPNARISKFSGDDGWFEAVEKDQADALIYDYPFAAEEIKEHPRTMIVKYNLNQSKYAVGVPGRQFRSGLRGQFGDRQVQGDAAVRRR